MIAAYKGHDEVCKYLLRMGADPHLVQQTGFNSVLLACLQVCLCSRMRLGVCWQISVVLYLRAYLFTALYTGVCVHMHK